jgi:hypothetical protein
MKKAVVTCKSRSVNRMYWKAKGWIDESGTKMQWLVYEKGRGSEGWEIILLFACCFTLYFAEEV